MDNGVRVKLREKVVDEEIQDESADTITLLLRNSAVERIRATNNKQEF